MKGLQEVTIRTSGEKFYDVTSEVQTAVRELCRETGSQNGVVHLMLMHTSCGMCLGEAYDPSARHDMEKFLQHLAPRNLAFIRHTDEGPDDSPSHMKSILLHQAMTLIVVDGKALLGTWQGIYLCEFRDGARSRHITLKLQPDPK